MNKVLSAFALVLAFGMASLDADARRFGGGGNLGKQRATPTQREATPAQAPAAPNKAATPAPANSPAAAGAAGAAAKPGFMSRWGGLLAGLGIGVLLASLFGETLGPIVGLLLAGLLILGLVVLVMRLLANRRTPAPAGAPASFSGLDAGSRTEGERPRFSGIGSGVPGAAATPAAAAPRSTAVALPPDVDLAAFLRVAKTSFIRLQAANDSGDLDDIRDYTTPEVYAEIAMQVKERGAEPQRTEVVNLEAQLADFAREDGYDIASVRFYGLIREQAAANPEPFDEIWHVRRKAGDKRDPWLIAGIQQY